MLRANLCYNIGQSGQTCVVIIGQNEVGLIRIE
jgi:hypothetical protein